MKINQVYLGDCLEIIEQIPEKSIDLLLTDPPYNISRENNFSTMGRAGIDFGEWDKEADIFSYIDKCARIIKKNGSFVIFNDWKNLGDIARFGESKGLEVKDMIRFEKSNPMPRNRDRRYITDYECAIWMTVKGGKWTFNRQSETYQRPKFSCSLERGLHPTQKPVKLMEELIKIHSNEGDIILDCFAGSGSALLAGKNLKRNYIGIEKEEKYYNICLERLNEI